jgi:hypothetical protein
VAFKATIADEKPLAILGISGGKDFILLRIGDGLQECIDIRQF